MQPWPETNESLILRVKDPADAAAWSDFLSIYRPVVVPTACGNGLRHLDADENLKFPKDHVTGRGVSCVSL